MNVLSLEQVNRHYALQDLLFSILDSCFLVFYSCKQLQLQLQYTSVERDEAMEEKP